ncbi:MAG: YrhK family protein [Gammaproteobacteria bacterium]|nr:YrhK family protein [Gammaproteobacteria bacterium]
MSENRTSGQRSKSLVMKLGSEELVVGRRYEVLSKLNDIMLGLWFVVGSVFFFFESLQTAAIALFLVGSVQLLARPVIRIARDVHVEKPSKESWDY